MSAGPARSAAAVVLGAGLMLAVGCTGTDTDDVAATTQDAVEQSAAGGSEPASSTLVLAEGEVADVVGFSNSGEDAPGVDMSVSFSSMECSDVLVDADIDEFEKVVDMVADDSGQLCLVELVVTNTSAEPGWFSADLVGVGVTSSGETVRAAVSGYDPALLANNRDTRYAGDGLDPGESAYDYVVFPLSLDQEVVGIDFAS